MENSGFAASRVGLLPAKPQVSALGLNYTESVACRSSSAANTDAVKRENDKGAKAEPALLERIPRFDSGAVLISREQNTAMLDSVPQSNRKAEIT